MRRGDIVGTWFITSFCMRYQSPKPAGTVWKVIVTQIRSKGGGTRCIRPQLQKKFLFNTIHWIKKKKKLAYTHTHTHSGLHGADHLPNHTLLRLPLESQCLDNVDSFVHEALRAAPCSEEIHPTLKKVTSLKSKCLKWSPTAAKLFKQQASIFGSMTFVCVVMHSTSEAFH